MKRIKITKTFIIFYDDFKLKKTLWFPWFIKKYFSALKVKHKGLVKCCFKAGPAFTTLTKPWNNNGWIFCVYCYLILFLQWDIWAFFYAALPQQLQLRRMDQNRSNLYAMKWYLNLFKNVRAKKKIFSILTDSFSLVLTCLVEILSNQY